MFVLLLSQIALENKILNLFLYMDRLEFFKCKIKRAISFGTISIVLSSKSLLSYNSVEIYFTYLICFVKLLSLWIAKKNDSGRRKKILILVYIGGFSGRQLHEFNINVIFM